ncbi:extensin family protein [Aestuariivirga sp.]|uniref:extensin-like domain-containing protein n=1 Tax=Aestuariivirga sp. TaxID=2650926 RepID=UPI003593C2DA
MVSLRNVLAAACVAAVLAGCGSSKKSYFETEGLRAPEGSCDIKPSRIGLAEKIRNIDEGNGCEVRNAWRVQSVGSVSFSQPATVNCGMAEPLRDWLEGTVQPEAQRAFGESVVGVDVAASYACRPRNNKRGARMSEHGYGNAIDISAFTLESGRKVTVLGGWRGGREEQRFLRAVHGEACSEFRTVLGPNADANHRDHIHLDLQNRKSGKSYCR